MKCRKLIPRLLVLATIGLAVGGYFVYRQWTDPAAVRQAVLAELATRMPGAEVRLGAAELRLLGGVELTHLELVRKDDEAGLPFAVLPSVILRHDKEELSRGRLVIRKIELHEPRLTLVRRADGSWNLSGLLADGTAQQDLPVIEVQQGTVTLVDEMAKRGEIEVRHVQLKAIPDNDGRYHLQMEGQSEQLGRVTLEGTAQPRSGELQITGKLPALKVDSSLLQALSPRTSPAKGHELRVEGKAAVDFEVARQPGAATPWSHQASVTLREGKLLHPQLPIPLEGVTASANWNGAALTIEQLDARGYGAKVRAQGEISGLNADADLRLRIEVEHLQITKDVYEKLPPQMAKLCADFLPEGSLSLKSEVRQSAGQFTIGYTATLKGASFRYKEFPHPVSGVTGTLTYTEENSTPELAIKLNGFASRRPVQVLGRVYGVGLRAGAPERPGIQIDITGSNLPIEEPLIAALPDNSQRVARQFKPGGLVDARAELRRAPGNTAADRPPMENRYVLRFHDARMCYEKFPYPVEEVAGTLELLPGGRWTATGFRGRHKGGLFTCTASSEPSPAGDRIVVNVQGVGATLDEEMKAALSPKMKHVYSLFSPQGLVDFQARVDTVGKQEPQLDLQLTAQGCAMKPTCFPYQLHKVRGTFHYAKDRVTLKEFRAEHGDAAITLGRGGEGGVVDIGPGGGFRATLWHLRAEPLPVDKELLAAMPKLVRQALESLQPDRPIRIITDLTIADPGNGGKVRYDWDGHVAFADTTLQCGFPLTHVTGLLALVGKHDGVNLEASGNLQCAQMTLGKQVFREVRSELKLSQHALVFSGLHAALHGGELYGPIRLDFQPELSYRVDLTASNVDLEQFARETLGRAGQVKGKARARLDLRGKGTDLSTLQGTGSMDITEGKLYDLPLVLDLLSTLSGHLPKGSAFQEASAAFSIDGDRLRLMKLQLIGDALTLEGHGSMRVDGSMIDLEMYGLLWGRTIPLLPALIDQIPSWLSKRLMKIRLEGNLAKVNTKLEPVPVIVEPVKALLKSVAGRQPMEGMRLRGGP